MPKQEVFPSLLKTHSYSPLKPVKDNLRRKDIFMIMVQQALLNDYQQKSRTSKNTSCWSYNLEFYLHTCIHVCMCVCMYYLHFAIYFVILLPSFQITLFNRVMVPKKMLTPHHPILAPLKNPSDLQNSRIRAFQFPK